MDSLETALMAKIWNTILVRFNKTSKDFQGIDVDLKKVVDLIDSFEKFLKSLRERYEELELEAKNLCGNTQYKSTKERPRKRNKRYDTNTKSASEQVGLNISPRENFTCETFNVILDQLSVALQQQRVAYQSVYDRFKVVVNLCTLSEAEIKTEVEKLASASPKDFRRVVCLLRKLSNLQLLPKAQIMCHSIPTGNFVT